MTPTNLPTGLPLPMKTGNGLLGDNGRLHSNERKVKNIALPFQESDYEVIKLAAKKDSRSMGAFLLVAAREYIKAHNLDL